MDKKELERRLDRMCSTIVRCNEKCCFTCGKHLSMRKREAGHFIPRTVKATRWDLDNIHVQCHKCNVALGGNLAVYEKRMKEWYKRAYDDLREKYGFYLSGLLPEPSWEAKAIKYNWLLSSFKHDFRGDGRYTHYGAYAKDWDFIELE